MNSTCSLRASAAEISTAGQAISLGKAYTMDGNVNVAAIAVGSVPGLLALAGSLIGFGRLTQRLKHVEEDVAGMKLAVAQVAVMDERTKNTDDNVKEIRSGMASLTQTLLNRTMEELRSFHPKG